MKNFIVFLLCLFFIGCEQEDNTHTCLKQRNDYKWYDTYWYQTNHQLLETFIFNGNDNDVNLMINNYYREGQYSDTSYYEDWNEHNDSIYLGVYQGDTLWEYVGGYDTTVIVNLRKWIYYCECD